jgi:non-heme chloroperoxidase
MEHMETLSSCGLYDYDVHTRDIKKVLDHLDIKKAVLGGFSMGGSIWTQRKDFPYNLQKSAVDALLELNHKDRPKLLSEFTKIFSATPTSLNKGIRNWLNGICLSASSYATANCLIALRDTDLRKNLTKIKIPTFIMHGKQDKICTYDLAEQMRAGILDSQLITFENSGHSLFLEETEKFNSALIKFGGK